MTFTEDELRGLRLLLREELQSELGSLRSDVDKRFDEIATQIDGLYHRDEKREQDTWLSESRSDASKPSSLS